MAVTREAAIEALFAKLSSATWGSSQTFGLKTRRLIAPEQMAAPGSAPGLALVVHHEKTSRPSPTRPPVRTVTAVAVVYIDVSGQANVNVIPDAVLNPIKDAVEAALGVDSGQTGTCTLGGAVYAAFVSGETIQAAGDATGKGLAVIPIDIILP